MFNLKDLSKLDHAERCKGTKMPKEYVPFNKYTDKTSSGLEKAICRFLVLQGHQAERIKNQGRRIDTRETFTDVLGNTRVIGSDKWIKGTGTNGSHDVHSTIKLNINGHIIGMKVTWEVKIGRDTIKPDQIAYAEDVRRAGGRAFFVRTWESFYSQYESLMNEFGELYKGGTVE